MQWRQMTPPPRSRPQEHAGHMRGRSNQYAGKGRTTPGTDSQSGSDNGSNTCQRGKGRRMTGWQEREALAPCDNPSNLNDASEPASHEGGAGRNCDLPL